MPFPRFRSSFALAVVLVLAACNAPSRGLPPSPDSNSGAADAPLPADASNVVRPDAHGADAHGADAHSADAHSADASPAPADAGGTPGADAASPDAGSPGSDAGSAGSDAGSSGSDAGSAGSDAGSAGSDAGSSGGDAGSSGSDAGSSGSDAGSSGGGGGVISCYTEGDPGATCKLPTQCCFSNYSSQHDGACSTTACTWGTIECDGPEDCDGGQHCCAHAIVTPDSGVIGYQLACQASACGAAPANEEMCHPTTASAAGTCSSPTSRCVTAFGNDNDLPPSLHICQ